MTPEQRDRLMKVLRMMGSSHMGERATAASLADTLAKALGGWEVLLVSRVNAGHQQQQRQQQPPPPPPGPPDWWRMRDIAASYPSLLTPWEADFLLDFMSPQRRYSRNLTPRQHAVFVKMHDKAQAAVAAGHVEPPPSATARQQHRENARPHSNGGRDNRWADPPQWEPPHDYSDEPPF